MEDSEKKLPPATSAGGESSSAANVGATGAATTDQSTSENRTGVAAAKGNGSSNFGGGATTTKDAEQQQPSDQSPHDVIGAGASGVVSTTTASSAEEGGTSAALAAQDPDATPRPTAVPPKQPQHPKPGGDGGGDVPEPASKRLKSEQQFDSAHSATNGHPSEVVKPATSSNSLVSSASEFSTSSAAAAAAAGQYHDPMDEAGHHGLSASPVPTSYSVLNDEGPPAPPSTPASHQSTFSWDAASASTPLPIITTANAVENATLLERQQLLLEEGAVTPAPNRPLPPEPASAARTVDRRAGASKDQQRTGTGSFPEDFSDWAVGDRYEMVRMLGRGSYGEVAQAIDLYAGRRDAFVAIKRIQSPFDQEVDAIRLYREIHILRRMRGHECIIQLLDIVQPPTDDLDDFHDLYLVFECKYAENEQALSSCSFYGSSVLILLFISASLSCRCRYGFV